MPIRGLTWHDDIREAEFAGDGDAAVEDHRILSTDLFGLSPEQLQGDDQPCSENREGEKGREEVNHTYSGAVESLKSQIKRAYRDERLEQEKIQEP